MSELDEIEETEIELEIDHDTGDGIVMVKLTEDGKTRYVQLTPEEARALADSLQSHADDAEG